MDQARTYNRSHRRSWFSDWFWLARHERESRAASGERLTSALALRAAAVVVTFGVVGGIYLWSSDPADEPATSSTPTLPALGDVQAEASARGAESETGDPAAPAAEAGKAGHDADARPPGQRSLTDRLLKAARDHQFSEGPETPVVASPRETSRPTAYSPPFPEREEMFIAPQIESAPRTQRAASSSTNIALKGIAYLDGQQALVEINGRVFHLRENQEQQGVSVVSIQPPQVTLRHGEHEWTESLSDPRQASAKAKPRRPAN